MRLSKSEDRVKNIGGDGEGEGEEEGGEERDGGGDGVWEGGRERTLTKADDTVTWCQPWVWSYPLPLLSMSFSIISIHKFLFCLS